jgi:excinuclease UvrABC nuclease subunit
MSTNTVNWLGHQFTVCKQDANWNEVSGIYIFCGVNPQNQWVPIYIGQADNLRTRIQSHEQWNPALRLGATHVHALAVELASQRDSIEKQLVGNYQPQLNVHHK